MMLSLYCLAKQRSFASLLARFFPGSFCVWIFAGLTVYTLTAGPQQQPISLLFAEPAQNRPDDRAISGPAKVTTAIPGRNLPDLPVLMAKPAIYTVFPVIGGRIAFMFESQRAPPVSIL